MKKLLLLSFVASASLSWGRQVGAAGRLLENEYRQNRQSRMISGRNDNIVINLDYCWEQDYNEGYAEIFVRIPEGGRFTVSIGDQEITNANGMFRFFDVPAISQPLSIWQGRTLIYRVTLSPRDNTRMVMDFFSREGLYLLEEVRLTNNLPSYQGRQWNDLWNRSYSGRNYNPQHPYPPAVAVQPMPPAEFDKFFRMFKKETFDDDKLSFFRMQKNLITLTTNQVAQLMGTMSFGDNKLALSKEAFSRVVDPYNYYLLLDKLTFSSEKDELKAFLQSMQQ